MRRGMSGCACPLPGINNKDDDMNIDFDSLGYTLMNPDDTFSFQCIRCGECCREVKDAVMLESLDVFRLAQHLKQPLEEVIEQHTDVRYIAWGFPVLMLKTTGDRDSCVFLESSRCRCQDAKPRTCRTYPMGVGPADEHEGEFQMFLVSQKQHHYSGQVRRAGAWFDETLPAEDRAYILSEYNWTAKFGRIISGIDRGCEDDVSFAMLLHKYFNYDPLFGFREQFEHNMKMLEQRMLQLVK